MRIRELAEKCIDRDVDCDFCPYEKVCNSLSGRLEDISPYGLVEMIDKNEEVFNE